MPLPKTWQQWLKGVVAGFIQGAAGSLTTTLVAPTQFNFTTVVGFEHVLVLAGVNGLLGMALYLKQSPVPGDPPAGN